MPLNVGGKNTAVGSWVKFHTFLVCSVPYHSVLIHLQENEQDHIHTYAYIQEKNDPEKTVIPTFLGISLRVKLLQGETQDALIVGAEPR